MKCASGRIPNESVHVLPFFMHSCEDSARRTPTRRRLLNVELCFMSESVTVTSSQRTQLQSVSIQFNKSSAPAKGSLRRQETAGKQQGAGKRNDLTISPRPARARDNPQPGLLETHDLTLVCPCGWRCRWPMAVASHQSTQEIWIMCFMVHLRSRSCEKKSSPSSKQQT